MPPVELDLPENTTWRSQLRSGALALDRGTSFSCVWLYPPKSSGDGREECVERRMEAVQRGVHRDGNDAWRLRPREFG
jgi:hypothetical protein